MWILETFWSLLGMPTETEHVIAKLYRLGELETFQLTLQELNDIKRTGKNVGQDLAFFLFWLPLGIGSAVNLVTLPSLSIKAYCSYFIMMLVSAGFSIYFGVRAHRQRGTFEALIDEIIRVRRFGPAGAGDREISQSQLASLPLESAPAPPLQSPDSHGVSESIQVTVTPAQPAGEQK